MEKKVIQFAKQVFLYGFFSVVVLGILFSAVLVLLPKQTEQLEHKNVTVRAPQALTTDVWGVFNPQTGEIIKGNGIDTPRSIASVTKLFTAYAVVTSVKNNMPFTIAFADTAEEGRAGKLVAGEKTTPYELLYPLLLESSNDAAHATKRYLGEEYSATMAQLKNELSLTKTYIDDGSGLSAKNISTVRELALFFTHVKNTYPHILDITQLRMYVGEKGNGYINNDPARTLETFTGGKHGYTDAAGRTFVGTFMARNTGVEFGVILLGSGDLMADITKLIAYGENVAVSSDILLP